MQRRLTWQYVLVTEVFSEKTVDPEGAVQTKVIAVITKAQVAVVITIFVAVRVIVILFLFGWLIGFLILRSLLLVGSLRVYLLDFQQEVSQIKDEQDLK